ncbi:MAG: hypothetical protein LAT53_06450 [Idiomarina sp.]|nr:hypothetical protein [Idiomarina sp.]
MANQLDVLALAEEVKRDCESGALYQDLLSQGQTLYGKNPTYPDHIERITPDGKRTLGYWHHGQFVEDFCLLLNRVL